MNQTTHETRRPRCTARRSRDGAPCAAYAIRGGTVCRTHGGSAPQVKRSADERLAAMVDPALTGLLRIVRNGETDTVKLAAIKDVLDRAGYKPKAKVDVTSTGGVHIFLPAKLGDEPAP